MKGDESLNLDIEDLSWFIDLFLVAVARLTLLIFLEAKHDALTFP